MQDQIFIIQDNGTLIEMERSDYVTEDIFQKLLEEYPALIPGAQIDNDNPRKWLMIGREVGIPGENDGCERWSLDHLMLDQDGIPTFVEVKRASDTRIRREVIGQMLDYAANAIVYWSVGTIRELFEKTCDDRGKHAGTELADLFDLDFEPEIYWEKVDNHLQTGKIRLLFVADKIPKELLRVIEFLNEQMSPAEVFAVELPQYEGHGVKSIAPRILGKTVQADKKKNRSTTSARIKWTDELIEQELKKQDPKRARCVRILCDFTADHSDKFPIKEYGTGSLTASINYKNSMNRRLFSIYFDGIFGVLGPNPDVTDYTQFYKLLEKYSTFKWSAEFKSNGSNAPRLKKRLEDLSDHEIDRLKSFLLEFADL
jgi:hypothetical protein